MRALLPSLRMAAVGAIAAALGIAGFSLTAFGSPKDSPGTLTVAKASGYMKGYEVLTWAPTALAKSFVLYRDGVRVSTAGPAATSTRFLLTPGSHTIAAVAVLESPPTATTVPTPPTTTTIPPATTTTAPTTTTPPAGTVIPFGDFSDGTVCGELADCTWNWFAPHVTIEKGAGPNGSNSARLVADDSMTFPNQGNLVRIHGIGFKSGLPSWFNNGHDVWRGETLEVPASSTWTSTRNTTTDEIHGDNGTGAAPLNLSFTRGGEWRIYIRGSVSPLVSSGGYPFAQWIFGPDDGSGDYGGATYRHHQDWVGGNKPVVPGEQISFRMHWHLDTKNGSFEAWARWPGSNGWRYIVPLKTGIPTSYPDTSGDGKAVYPMMSLYYDAGGGRPNAVEYMDGAYSDDGSALAAWQDQRVNP